MPKPGNVSMSTVVKETTQLVEEGLVYSSIFNSMFGFGTLEFSTSNISTKGCMNKDFRVLQLKAKNESIHQPVLVDSHQWGPCSLNNLRSFFVSGNGAKLHGPLTAVAALHLETEPHPYNPKTHDVKIRAVRVSNGTPDIPYDV